MGPFKKCTCSIPVAERRSLHAGFQRDGHQVGPFSIVIHQSHCQRAMGTGMPHVCLFKCDGSRPAKIDHNDYLHPDADHSGRLNMPPSQRAKLEMDIAKGAWGAARLRVHSSLGALSDHGYSRLKHFPKVAMPTPKSEPIATRFVPPFEAKGHLLGPYFIELHKASKNCLDIRLRGCDQTAIAWKDGVEQRNLHPHTDTDGRLDTSPVASHLLAVAHSSPDEVLYAIEDYLRTGISDADAYLQLRYWPRDTSTPKPKQVFVVNVELTYDNGDVEQECWGVLTSVESALEQLGNSSEFNGWDLAGVIGGGQWWGTPIPGSSITQAYATIDTHALEE